MMAWVGVEETNTDPNQCLGAARSQRGAGSRSCRRVHKESINRKSNLSSPQSHPAVLAWDFWESEDWSRTLTLKPKEGKRLRSKVVGSQSFWGLFQDPGPDLPKKVPWAVNVTSSCSIEFRVMAINDVVRQPARAVSQLPVWEQCNGWPVWKGLLSGEGPCGRGADGQME